jgi:O-antigen/teichoic acid export membrane protein
MATAPPAHDPATAQEDAAGARRRELDGDKATKRQLRGSSLLLAGRILSLGVNFVTQVLIVRYLSKNDFGIFAYGLSMVALGEAIATVGLDKGISRFLPIYDERKQYAKLFGTLFMSLGTVLGLGLAFLLLAFGLDGFAGGDMANDPHAITVLLIILCLSPLQALDGIFMGAFAVFGNPRAIFFRKYVLAPGLRLAAIGLVILSAGGVEELAAGYVIAGALGIVLYVFMLASSLKADGLLPHMDLRRMEYPAREIFGFCLPLIVVDLLFVVMNTTNVFMLEAFGSTTDVADYRVVQPAAKLNLLVMTSFALLFTPQAARFFARGDNEGISNLYWRTAAWMAVFSFPIFAMTCMSSHPVTVALFGERYASSAPILALLSLGYYFNAALGYNGLTLRVYGLVKLVVNVSIAAAVANVLVNLALIPAYGAVGAGIGTCVTLILHNGLKQWGLRRGTGISILDPRMRRTYGSVLLGTLLLGAVNLALQPNVVVALVLAAIVSLAVVRFNRSELQVAETFPELSRIPLLGRILS